MTIPFSCAAIQTVSFGAMSRSHNLDWVANLLPDGAIETNMHDGVGYFLDHKLVLILIESSRTTVYKGIDYPFQLWNGVFFPVEPIKQSAVFLKFMFLENHPALKNTLYLSAEFEDFEENVKKVMRDIGKRNPLFGEPIRIKKTRESSAATQDPRRPTLFADEPLMGRVNPKPKADPKSPPVPAKKVKANKKPGNQFLLDKLRRK